MVVFLTKQPLKKVKASQKRQKLWLIRWIWSNNKKGGKEGGRGERRKGAKEERERGPISYKYLVDYWCATWWVTFPTYL
jgi:hypothetical protein